VIKLLTYTSPEWKPLSDITNPNKQEYCDKWGYEFIPVVIEESPAPITLPIDRMIAVRDNLDGCDWIWFTGTDSLITNYNKDIKEVTDENADFILASDFHWFNDDSALIRNSEMGRIILNALIDEMPQYLTKLAIPSIPESCNGQGVLMLMLQENRYGNHLKLVTQRMMNSMLYNLFPVPSNRYDRFGNSGNWEPGDLLMHWPALAFDHRMRLAQQYIGQVIK
jgi:hypothetical protein